MKKTNNIKSLFAFYSKSDVAHLWSRVQRREFSDDMMKMHWPLIKASTRIQIFSSNCWSLYAGLWPGGGGGTSILKVSGTCRWTGYDFAIIAIKTGCLNQPNHWHRVSKSAYLATGTDYSVYHRVAFPPTMFMTGPRSRHRRDASVRAGPVFQRSLICFFLWTGVNYIKSYLLSLCYCKFN